MDSLIAGGKGSGMEVTQMGGQIILSICSLFPGYTFLFLALSVATPVATQT